MKFVTDGHKVMKKSVKTFSVGLGSVCLREWFPKVALGNGRGDRLTSEKKDVSRSLFMPCI